MSNFPARSFHQEFSVSERPPAPRVELNHSMGPHQAQIAPISSTIAQGRYPDCLFLGLLSKLPVSDGAHLIELDAPDYARQPISLVPRSATHLCVPRPILFEVHRLPVIAGFGLFDQQTGGTLVGYGAVYSSRLSRDPVERIEVRTHQLLVKRLPISKDSF